MTSESREAVTSRREDDYFTTQELNELRIKMANTPHHKICMMDVRPFLNKIDELEAELEHWRGRVS